MTLIVNNLLTVKQNIAAYELHYHRKQGSVHLLAVSKGHPISSILAAMSAGQRQFGESYLQEALQKIEDIDLPDIEWHFIGPIQSNKTKKIAEHFAWVHGVPNAKIAQRLNDQRPKHLPPLNICIEVNISAEPSKSGASVNEVSALVAFCAALPQLTLRGFMAIPAVHDTLDAQRKAFRPLFLLLHEFINQGYALDTLSMGMSDDLEAAIAEGATIVRVGTAIFGSRTSD